MGTASVVLVTNVGQGFGRAVALACGHGGHDVVCADRDVDLASKTAAEIEELGGQAIPIQADMTTHMDVLNAFHKVYEIFGDLNGVIHVAAYGSHTPFHALGESEFVELLDEDIKSSYLTLKVCAQVLREGWLVLVAPPESADEPQMTAVRGALSGMVAGFGDRYERLRANMVVPSRQASDPRHDAALIDSVLYLGSATAQGVRGQQLYVELPPPPKVVESLLPEVQAALDSSVRQDDLEASLYDDGNEDSFDNGNDGDDGEREFADEVAFPRELPGCARPLGDGATMKCPYCTSNDTRVINSRPSDEGTSIRRRRDCANCHRRFTTYERAQFEALMVSKRSGRREAFNPDKLLDKLRIACNKRPVTEKQLREFAYGFEDEIQAPEIASEEVGLRTLKFLKGLDDVAYIRFLSVYRDFDSVDRFIEEIRQLGELAALRANEARSADRRGAASRTQGDEEGGPELDGGGDD